MTVESILWFIGQAVVGVVAIPVGRRIARARPVIWKTVATFVSAVAALCPVMRLFSDEALHVFPARILIFIEATAIIVPAVLLFSIASLHVAARDRRPVYVVLVVCGLFYVRAGLWMLKPPVPEAKMSHYMDGVCRQSTDYTCVAASLVTMLSFHGIQATEMEMARLSYTEIGEGSTDTRAVYALQRKLAGQPLEVRYERMDYDRLRQVELPCIVPTEWGYFTSHMVPVLSISDDSVAVGNPLTGRRDIDRAEFLRIWLKRGIYLHRSGPPRDLLSDGDRLR
jgi:predicted double-glycine peptidase